MVRLIGNIFIRVGVFTLGAGLLIKYGHKETAKILKATMDGFYAYMKKEVMNIQAEALGFKPPFK